MVIFRVTNNINIKTTDGTLVSYFKLKGPSNLINETLYITTYEDFLDLKRVFKNVDEKKYQVKVIEESRVTNNEQFPKELGIVNKNEFNTIVKKRKELITKNSNFSDNLDFISLFLNNKKVNLHEQVSNTLKQDIKIAILGNMGFNIGEMVSSVSALRIFYEQLKKRFSTVKIDIYLNSSENKQFTRDKQIFENQEFVNKVTALSISVKKLCEYDYYIDTSLVTKTAYYEKLNYVDAWLYKLGIDFEKIDDSRKYNSLNLNRYKPSKSLVQKISDIRLKGKVLLYHPFSADANRSIPKEIAINILKKLINKLTDYTIISTLNIDGVKDSAYVDLSSYSKSFLDYAFIISNADKIITVDTATYHISDIFFIPSVVVFTEEKLVNRIKYYENCKAVLVCDKSKNLSLFNFDKNSLVLNRFEAWKDLKVKQIIKLLD
ncbi:hypothetical protein CP960_12550 [Malaciobacter halophilus]|uniref:Uncharacterized protein n=1 Tax=Malaciobacter halophilus TaxID=197482 RepID=A0A2N1J007_9BACT|nr:hypothetical protein [Malaciobacter halophilus]AXH10514.1 hypothetical protein AHALO_2173 [Malaciobacter halophilus]PKI79834.1 hypothetical protein CP960_12550 [Malaciobacter halophilus]